jgi:hypothetical protein
MVPYALDANTLAAIRRLVESNYVGRDELYAAADVLDNDARQSVCRRLAEFLAAHAAELQQILLGCHAKPVEIEDIPVVAEHGLFDILKARGGSAGVIAAAERCEHAVKEEYDRAVEATADDRAKGVLHRQRKDVEFGEQVLHVMIHSAGVGPTTK